MKMQSVFPFAQLERESRLNSRNYQAEGLGKGKTLVNTRAPTVLSRITEILSTS
jgi:hypothetical protein